MAATLTQRDAIIDGDIILGLVREIGQDDGKWDNTIPFDAKAVAKELKEKEGVDVPPMFVEVLVLHVGSSKKDDGTENVGYSEQAVRETAKLLPGSMAYLGHQKPEDAEFEYRDPTGKYVASRASIEDVPNVGRVLCAVGKCYVSAAAKGFRTNVREGLAGAVSIHGTAAFKVEAGRRTNQTVGMRRLKSVDFCNPGTPGVRAAGVQAVVREIASSDAGGRKNMDPVTISSVAQLQSQYPDLCKMLVSQETASFDKSVREITARAEKAEGKVTTLEAQVTEITKAKTTAEAAHTEAKTAREKAEGEVKEMQKTARLSRIKDSLAKKIDARIEAAKAGDDKAKAKVEAAVLEMAKKQHEVKADVLHAGDDENGTISLANAERAFDATVGTVREMATNMGFVPGSGTPRDVREITAGGTTGTDNPNRGGLDKRLRDLSPSYRAAREREEKAKTPATK